MELSLRQREIVEIARRTGRVTVEGLAARFGVTPQTIRRDLSELCDAKALARVHGGAVAVTARNVEYAERSALASEAKDLIGRACAAEVPNGSSLFINIGTTAEAVARHLLEHRDLLVVTNNLNVASTLAQNPDVEVIVAGGALRRADGGLVGEATVDLIRQFRLDLAIVGASAIDADGALLDFDFREVRAAQAILEHSRLRWLVADATKFTRTAPVMIAPMSVLDAVFTDAPPPEAIRRICDERHVAVRLPDAAPGLSRAAE